jgi:hypothetical protein
LAKRRAIGREDCESLEATVEGLRQEVRVLRQAIDEFRVDFTHALRHLPDSLTPPYQHLRSLAESFAIEHAADAADKQSSESLCCYECDAAPTVGLAAAVQIGWIDITCAEEAHGTEFVGWCPACQRTYEEESRRINTGVTHPQG